MSNLNSWQERTIANGVAIDVLDKQMLTANQSIAILQAGLTANDTAISTLQANVSANTTAISSLQGLVSANITSISTINDSLTEKANKALPVWIAPTLINSWGIYNNITPGFRKDDFGRIYCKGVLSGGTPSTIAFIYPEGYRPTQLRYFGFAYGGRGYVNTDGEFTIVACTTYASLDQICFDTL
jgi:hypothetical protein